jgi:metal-responsive CopG/Arc/MetJ family transcriptional regulator
MHRLNLTIDEGLYEQIRVISFLEKKSISQMVREGLKEYIEKNVTTKKQAELILASDDETEILNILKNDTFISESDFKKQFAL